MLELVTAAGADAISVSDAKSWMRVTSSSEDTLIQALVRAAIERLEHYTGRKFVTQTHRLWLDGWPLQNDDEWWDGVREGAWIEKRANFIDLRLAPVSVIDEVKYYLTDNSEQVFDASNYYLDGVTFPSRLVLNYSALWPSAVLRPLKSISVKFQVGYGASSAHVPNAIATAIKMLTAHFYKNRGDGCETEIPSTVKELLKPYVIQVL